MTAPRRWKLIGFVPPDALDRVRAAVFAAGAGHIGDYDSCSWSTAGTGTFRGGEQTTPAVGTAGVFEQVPEIRFETVVNNADIVAVCSAFVNAHPYEEPAFDVIPLHEVSVTRSANPESNVVEQQRIEPTSDAGALPADHGVQPPFESLLMHFDGGSRGNPGPAAAGWVLYAPEIDTADGTMLEVGRRGVSVGRATNNLAEWTGLVKGIEHALELGCRRLQIRGDSELVIKQLRGEYRVKNIDLKPLHEQAHALLAGCDKWSAEHVRRGGNAVADAIVNEVLDEQAASG